MFRGLLVATGLSFAPTIALAQVLAGLPGSPYVSVAGGLNFAGSPLSATGSLQLRTNTGGLGIADLGWAFGNGLRAEIEGSYRSNGLASINTPQGTGARLPLTNEHGSLRTWALMVNGAYDIPLASFGLAWPFQPYIGAGIGCAWVDLSNAGGDDGRTRILLPDQNSFTGPASISFGSGSAFAYQAIAGASMPLAVVPGLEATLEYRFFGTTRADVPTTAVALTTNTINGAIPSGTANRGYSLNENAVLFGLRYRF